MKLVSVPEMQAIEREANEAGLTYEEMMENAGGGLAEAVHRAYSQVRSRTVLGLVGSGNNGGDTLVALARLCSEVRTGSSGWKSIAYLARPREAGDPLVDRLVSAGGTIINGAEDTGFRKLASLVAENAVLLDGILGTGARLPLKKEITKVLGAARKAVMDAEIPPHVVAVDCPSGVDCNSGSAAPECIPAELTVTMAAVKTGLVQFPAFNLVGNIEVVGIGDLESYESWKSIQRLVADIDMVRKVLPPRLPDAHKGTFGTALVVAGSVNYTGAVLLAGEAAYRVGAGLVTMAVPASLHGALAGQLPEATWVLLPHEVGVIAESAVPVLEKNLGRATALLIGPGFGMEDTTRAFISRLVGQTAAGKRAGIGFGVSSGGGTEEKRPALPALVFDADGLKLLSRLSDWPKRLHERSETPAVLTPHPGEMSILTGLPVNEIQADRTATAERFAGEWGHVVVLKGALTVIAAPDGQTVVIPVATPALARAGTGDVLSGIIVGLRAQGLDAFQAACCGAWIHAQAGLMAAEALGNTASVLAGDVLTAVTDVMNMVS